MNWRLEPERPRRRRLIGLTPLIDVVFILLVFFMLVTAFDPWQPLPLLLADAPSAASDPSAGRSARIEVAADGGLRLNGVAIEAAALRVRLEQLRTDRPPLERVTIAPAAEAALQALLPAIDAARLAGLEDLRIERDWP
jgi:biopolymer transport protein ExbD